MKSLNLGCGTDIRPGWVNLDAAGLPGVDVVHDLNRMPLPFVDCEFSLIHAKDVLEHVRYVEVLRELHQILASGGIWKIQLPQFASADNYIDLTYSSQFSIQNFDSFVANKRDALIYSIGSAYGPMERQQIKFFSARLLRKSLVQPLGNSQIKLQEYYALTHLDRLYPVQKITVALRRRHGRSVAAKMGMATALEAPAASLSRHGASVYCPAALLAIQ